MKLEKTDKEILMYMVKDVEKEYSINQLAIALNKPYAKVHASVGRLLNKDIITKKVMGRSHYCKVNYGNNIEIVSFVEYLRKEMFLKRSKSLSVVIDNIEDNLKMPNYILAVFGSFVEGKISKHSDFDVLIVTSKDQLRVAEKVLASVEKTSDVKVHGIEVSYKQFIEMLGMKKLNLANEVAKNHIILHGAEEFYECLKLAK